MPLWRRPYGFEKIYSTILDGPEYVEYANAHWRELIDRYRPSVMWGDIMYPPGANSKLSSDARRH